MGTNSNSEFQSNPEHKNNNKKVVSETGHAKNVANLQKLTEQINKGKKVYIYVEETSDLNTMFTNYGTKPDPKDTVIRKNKKYDPQ